MKEPTTWWHNRGIGVMPYSAASAEVLALIAAPNWESATFAAGKHPEQEHFDLDFRRRYAAILLRERGQ